MGVKITDPGALLLIQDKGRKGYQRFGISESGACDRESMEIANILVGNDPGEAVLEAALIGPVLEFTSGCVIALTGADMSPEINGSGCEMYRSIEVASGDVLAFRGLKKGLRTYIAFSGGIEMRTQLGSASTDLRAGIGGLDGTALKKGDLIEVRERIQGCGTFAGRTAARPRDLNGNYELRVIPGPEDGQFSEKGRKTFFEGEYTVGASSDRMGVRLEGPALEHISGADIISNGIPFGAVQAADDGLPMIMLSDRQTTGGYAKIGCVVSADHPLIAQAKSGDKISKYFGISKYTLYSYIDASKNL